MDIGNYLKSCAVDIQKAREEYLRKSAERKKHKYEYELPRFPPVTSRVVYSENILIHPKPSDDDPNLYFDKSVPFSMKVEAPDCSSDEQNKNDIPMGPS